VSNAYKLPKETPEQISVRDAAIQAALVKAAEIPLETARACAQVAALAVTCAHKGNSNAVSDAGVAALLAEAACRGAAYNVRINVSAMADPAAGKALGDAAAKLVAETHAFAEQATAAVEAAIGG
jgi:formiminotetrahydrofolate cyclodeaminase